MRIIDHLVGIDGGLSGANKALLAQLIKQPTAGLWSRTKNMVICNQPIITLNASVRAVTQGQVAIGEFPDTFTLYRALKYSIDKRNRCFRSMEASDTES
ncbi:MAG: hypothetical protein PVG89_11890 [Gammaproteobacteria bacterium]|jgi:hypothetical protein